MSDNKSKKPKIRVRLVIYDLLILLFAYFALLVLYRGNGNISYLGILVQFLISAVCIFSARFIGRIYRQVWRYGGIQCYMRLLAVDACAFFVNLALEYILPIEQIALARLPSISCVNLLGALSIRMMYRYVYKCGGNQNAYGRFLRAVYRIFSGNKSDDLIKESTQKIKIAIIGAGNVGVNLAEDLLGNPNAAYIPRCFVDVQNEKMGKEIHGISVLPENEGTLKELEKYEIQEVVFALYDQTPARRKELYNYYLNAGFKIKVYDFPVISSANGKRRLRDFDVEELLFRKQVTIANDKTNSYYRDKVILITGGGGSIGSELCRQLAKMSPRRIIILDIYENGAYDVQQELRIAYGDSIDIKIEIVSITNKNGLRKVFKTYHPDIVIHAAAHKHVPLMEHNCVEATENNVFGTKNLVDLSEEYGVARFMMVSTDKAVNPTNVMGATKRMCEMIVLSASVNGKVKYSATRFGNVLGSAGSVIPLFKKQIANGGPVTITDKRIIRYFMTIPEASQLILESGAIANNGELFVLDMGQPVKIYDLAMSMIRLSGASNIRIVETGLREGEKLYEELLVKTETLYKTENSLIFIEMDQPLDEYETAEKLSILKEACVTGNDDAVRSALKRVVPTFHSPDEVNNAAEQPEEVKC